MEVPTRGVEAVSQFDTEMLNFFGVAPEPQDPAPQPDQPQAPALNQDLEDALNQPPRPVESQPTGDDIEEILSKYRTVKPVVDAIEDNPELGDFLAQQVQQYYLGQNQGGQPQAPAAQPAQPAAQPRPQAPQRPATADPYSPEMQEYLTKTIDYQQQLMQWELSERDRKLQAVEERLRQEDAMRQQALQQEQLRRMAQEKLKVEPQEAQQFVDWASKTAPQLSVEEMHLIFRHRNGIQPSAPAPQAQQGVPDIVAQRQMPTPQQQSRIDEYRNGQRLQVPLPASSQGQAADTRRPEDVVLDAILSDLKTRNPFS